MILLIIITFLLEIALMYILGIIQKPTIFHILIPTSNFFLFFGYIGYRDVISTDSFLIIITFNFTFILISLISFNLIRKISILNIPTENQAYKTTRILILITILSIILKFYLIHKLGGIKEFLTSPIEFTLKFTRKRFAFVSVLSSLSFYTIVYSLVFIKKKASKILLVILSILSILEGTRFPVMLSLFLIGYYIYLVHRVKSSDIKKSIWPFTRWIPILLFLIGILLLPILNYLNFIRNYGLVTWRSGLGFINFSDFNPIYNFSLLLKSVPKFKIFLPYIYLLTGYEFIPRLLFAEKLPTDPQYYFTVEYYGSYEKSTYTLTIPGELYYEMGLGGIILGAIIYGIISKIYFSTLLEKIESRSLKLKLLNSMIYTYICFTAISNYRTTLKNFIFQFLIFIMIYQIFPRIFNSTGVVK